MDDFSEENIRRNCPHCDENSQAFKYPLFETKDFRVICDGHPLIEGHILIIPKQHLSCIGEYPAELLEKFIKLDELVSDFVKKTYGSVSSFEHGKFGQTVFHSHVHYMPYKGNALDIVPEGKHKITKINSIRDLKKYYEKDGGYLYFTIGNDKWIVDPSLVAPRFFRDRFARALGRSERGNWKQMHNDDKLMEEAEIDSKNTIKNWREFVKSLNIN